MPLRGKDVKGGEWGDRREKKRRIQNTLSG